MTLLANVEYLMLGRQIAGLLGSAFEGPSAEALRELARVYDPSADEVRIRAEVFLFHKYVLMQACIGVFAESQVDYVVGGLFAALNERAGGLELSPDRREAMERMWQQRAREFDQPFSKDRADFLDEGLGLSIGMESFFDSVRTCERSRTLLTSGPATMASFKPQAVPSPRRSVRWSRPLERSTSSISAGRFNESTRLVKKYGTASHASAGD